MTPELRSAIEAIYAAFDNILKPMTIEGCPCCIERKNICELLSTPKRQLTPDQLSPYAFSVFLTVGDIDDFLYFLPRILEILTTETNWWPNPEVVAAAIHTSAYHSWPETLRLPVKSYFDAVFNELVESKDSGWKLSSWLCAFGRLHLDLIPFLNQISGNPKRLIEFYEINSDPLLDGRLSNGFWKEAPEEKQQVMAWFESDEIRNAINLAYGLG